jgi:hypothetical protein
MYDTADRNAMRDSTTENPFLIMEDALRSSRSLDANECPNQVN